MQRNFAILRIPLMACKAEGFGELPAAFAWVVIGLCVVVISAALKSSAQDIFAGPKFDRKTLSIGSAQEREPSAVTVADLVSRREFLGASISPDGRFFSYAVIQASIQNNSYQTVLVLAESKSPSHTW